MLSSVDLQSGDVSPLLTTTASITTASEPPLHAITLSVPSTDDLKTKLLPPASCPVADVDMDYSAAADNPDFLPTHFNDLPPEIHETILDHILGVRGSTLASITSATVTTSSWSKALRHPRRKALSDLALVSRAYRALVQGRIYRHIQVKGTTDCLAECAKWFDAHPHLKPYVRHIEIWVPVWGDRLRKSHFSPPSRRESGQANFGVIETNTMESYMHGLDALSSSRTNCNFKSASHNATLQQIFESVASQFPDAKMMTLEGGHCKKPPMIRHFESDPWGDSGLESFTPLPNIQTFIMKGAWNIMRDYSHWTNLSTALPNLREWHCFYAKSKREAHITISKVLRTFPPQLTRLNISLDGFCSKTSSRGFLNPQDEKHLCRLFGAILPQLESLTFTGKVCASLFLSGRAAVLSSQRKSKLKSVDLVVKACCWGHESDDGSLIPTDISGITNMSFIIEFEKLVIAAIHSLGALPALQYIRIRFIDLDSICGLLNPYFQLVGNTCTGVWSEAILKTLEENRPEAQFAELNNGILEDYGINSRTGTRSYPRSRPLSIKTSCYRIIADKSKP
ncbi:hypothetical protein H113_03290 [Trichophyton rubrum MR1459]|uniref:Uncharacterized protein n=4 Tax=Trichophyton TaxID=5550 RepID=A0A178EVF6_TRIRU|nr:uncharacterized protein TERG_05881 [Trichophyton rubrum CBS 118892]EZF96601.1 hypothetical protein H113_03290 [Trichophyton rubrum MR1459]EZG07520.1 hypothetical protein H106_03120 [Trichophyton rubrum CBS 735.88]KMQ46332.1 hypothetical protein HL42_3009 [Trichophyton rubrum]EGD89644.1 hypothetical protein TERG_05881 [Trichophyton rubrum CBS 118892]OAL63899.1 hypothetical protein A7C99_4551 [Trichophyton rubrum]